MLRMTRWMKSPALLWLIAGVGGVLCSLWRVVNIDAINPDGICYLRSAAAVLHEHTTSLHLCNQSGWPFYHILIAGVSALSHLSVASSAQLLNGLFSLGTVLVFVAIVFLLTKDKRVRWLAVITILFAHHLNAYRPDIIRDHGYWFFYLFSIYWLLHVPNAITLGSRWSYAFLWALCMGFAALFRLEGLALWVMLPCIIFFLPGQTRSARINTFLCLNSLFLIVLPVALIWIMLHSMQSTGRLNDLFRQVLHGGQLLQRHWNEAVLVMKHSVLSVYSATDADVILAMGLAGYYIFNLVDVMTPVYFVLLVYVIWRKPSVISGSNRIMLAACVLANVILTTFFLAQNFFLARRYLMALSLTMMLWVPFALDELMHRWHSKRKLLVLLACFFVICAIGGVVRFGASNKYVQEAGLWLAVHAAPDASIYSNDSVILHYANRQNSAVFNKNRPNMIDLIQTGGWRAYEWVALRGHNETSSGVPRIKPVKVFQNARGGEVKIYHIQKEERV